MSADAVGSLAWFIEQDSSMRAPHQRAAAFWFESYTQLLLTGLIT